MTDSLVELVELAVRVGEDPLHVQGGGGNLSLKAGGDLWVKASGAWLARARSEDAFLRVPLEVARAHATSASFTSALAPHHTQALRPSLETPMHALMPQRVVLHVHSVNVIAWAARADGPAQLGARLRGLRWAWVPYERPGPALAAAVQEALRAHDQPADVLVLGNHGLVLGADSCEAAYALLLEVDARVAVAPRPAGVPDEARLARANDLAWRTPEDPLLHGLATDAVTLDIAARGALYPDHAVFLGAHALVVHPEQTLSSALAGGASGAAGARYALVGGAGILLSPGLGAGALAMLGCLARVGARISDPGALAFLDEAEARALQDWESEAYRRAREPAPEGSCR